MNDMSSGVTSPILSRSKPLTMYSGSGSNPMSFKAAQKASEVILSSCLASINVKNLSGPPLSSTSSMNSRKAVSAVGSTSSYSTRFDLSSSSSFHNLTASSSY